MAAKFQNKYRIPSARWQAWDYSSEGLYFITINAAHHDCLFGTITNKEMYLSEFGQIVAEEWDKSFEIRNELFCDAFVIMPNHIHAILRIENPTDVVVETHGRASDDANNDVCWRIETHGRASLRDGDDNADNNPHSRADLRNAGNGIAYREPKSISSFVAGLKSAVTFRINTIRQTKGTPVWQTRFHDHVIRDHEECRRIGAYIDSNIANWQEDRYYQ
jgi:REP element-mobilizing transposase RayT